MVSQKGADSHKMSDEAWADFDDAVDRYLRKTMSAEEEHAFEEELQSSAEKRQRAASIALLITALRDVGAKHDEELIATMQNMSKERFRQVAGIKAKTYWRYIAIAACFVVILGIGTYSRIDYTHTVAIGTDNYAAYTFYENGQSRGADNSLVADTLSGLYKNIEEGYDLKATIAQLEAYYSAANDVSSDYNDHIDDIAWNLAMGHLKRGHKKKALPYLQDIVQRNSQYPEAAKVAQDIIDKIK